MAKESTEKKSTSTAATKETSKSKGTTKETPPNPSLKSNAAVEGSRGSTSTSASKGQASAGVGKDAFGRPVCGENEPECHESHAPFQTNKGGVTTEKKSQSVKEKDVKKSTRSFTEVNNDSFEKDCGDVSVYRKISSYCQDLVRRQAPVEPAGEVPLEMASTGPLMEKKQGGRSSSLVQSKRLQLVRRWLPTAGLYVVSTAALTAWVTEWGAVVKYIPFYKDAEEGSSNPSPAQPPEESE